jgi:hypothetical protein
MPYPGLITVELAKVNQSTSAVVLIVGYITTIFYAKLRSPKLRFCAKCLKSDKKSFGTKITNVCRTLC